MSMGVDGIGALWTVALIWGAAALVPGPDFLAIARASIGGGHRHGLACVVGVLCGTAAWGAAGVLGVSALFVAAPWLYLGFKVVGGGYLILVGLQLLRGALWGGTTAAGAPSVAARGDATAWRSFTRGLAANLSNPKTAIFVASIFATILPPSPSAALALSTVGVTTGVSLLWYAAVACFLSTPTVRRAYQRAWRWLAGIAGGLFILFGARLAVER
ncbi:LysE family transporter [Marivibrio halodurans]|uniref:LysE family transporter n=1 Tax=Marivibrio halodurans TaxID=2039722 RepID=A0A8J7SL43_9PROT|nr:LysE family transporter [Marivibrio halodurans]MBP5856623.1 LysE family transporter [Marivibrio halodurans]